MGGCGAYVVLMPPSTAMHAHSQVQLLQPAGRLAYSRAGQQAIKKAAVPIFNSFKRKDNDAEGDAEGKQRRMATLAPESEFQENLEIKLNNQAQRDAFQGLRNNVMEAVQTLPEVLKNHVGEVCADAPAVRQTQQAAAQSAGPYQLI